MKRLKQMLCVLLAVVMVLALAACGSNGGGSKETVPPDKVVEAFMDAYLAMDFQTATTYLDDASVLKDAVEYDSAKQGFLDDFVGQTPEMEPYRDDFEEFFDHMMQSIMDSIQYKIISTDVDGSNATVKIQVDAPDFDSIDMDAAMESVTGEDALMKILMPLIEDGTLTQNSTQEEMYDILVPEMIRLMTEAMDEAIANADPSESGEDDFHLVQKDGKWIIDTEKSDIEGLNINFGDLM